MKHIIDYDRMCLVCQGRQRYFRYEYSQTAGQEVLVGYDCKHCVGGYRAITIGKKNKY
tara:strand:+ start:609 stop:782 length:174 start_codon:yes stop_codon:yes gene_type:complete